MAEPMRRREFLKAGLAAGLAGAAVPPARAAAPGRRPNILFILTDQQNIDTIGAHAAHFTHPAHGPRWVSTPNLDRLVRRGVSFLESHSVNPVCSPNRSCLMTGRMAVETGVIVNNYGICRDVPNVAQWFASHGDYRRFYCGKWHLPAGYPAPEGPAAAEGFEVIPLGGTSCGDFNDYAVSQSTQAFLRSYRDDAPFLYVASLMNPHDICYWTPPLGGTVITRDADHCRLGDRLPPLPPNHDYAFEAQDPYAAQRITVWDEAHWRNYAYDYYRMIERVDADVGRMLDAIEDRDDETLVIFTSDHGEGLGRHRRVQKWHPFEQSLKVPLIVSCPGRIRENAIDTTHLTMSVDVVPTLCDFAGIPPPPNCRGRSLRPLLEGDPAVEWREHAYAEFQRAGRVLRTPRFKYAKFYRRSNKELEPFLDASGATSAFDPARIGDFQVEDARFLFDLQADPWETKNLAGDPQFADVVRDHDRLLRDAWEKRLIPGQPHRPGKV